MISLSEQHSPVLVSEVVDWLGPIPGGVYLDATLGLAGHTLNILKKTNGQARVIGCDRDRQSLELAKQRLEDEGYIGQVRFIHSSFACLDQEFREIDCPGFNGVLIDLGLSSWQLQDPERGFSFRSDGPLDMRMDRDEDKSARDLVNTSSFNELVRILREYGEEPLAKRIAQRIIDRRQKKEIESTKDLAQIVLKAYPGKRRSRSRNHPATKTFQALRIAVNSELRQLEYILNLIPDWCRPGARIVVISFHSLEDRIVKFSFKRQSQEPLEGIEANEHSGCSGPRLCVLTKKPITPGREEKSRNIRSRSSKLRVAERL